MIYPYDNASTARWDRGELRVQILVPTSDRPVAYCDGTEADEAELRAIAEAEGTELPVIHRKILKTGREIWTIGEAPKPGGDEDWMD